MKKTLFIIIITAVMLVSFAGCNKTATELTLSAVWKTSTHSYEKFTYTVSTTNPDGSLTAIGTYETEVSRIFNQSVTIGGIEYSDTNGDLIVNTLTNDDTVFSESVLFGAPSGSQRLTPYASYRETTKDATVTSQTIVYGENSCSVSQNGISSSEITFKKPYYDNAQLYTILRSAGSSFAFSAYVPIVAEDKVVELYCASASTATISCPYKDNIACYSVTVTRNEKLTGTPIYLYYSSSAVAVGNDSVSNALVKIVEGNIVYTLDAIEVA